MRIVKCNYVSVIGLTSNCSLLNTYILVHFGIHDDMSNISILFSTIGYIRLIFLPMLNKFNFCHAILL